MTFFILIFLGLFNVIFGANPDGSCTNPKFRWFKTLESFYNYAPNSNTNPAIRVNVTSPNARCLDGSPYAFYFRPGFGDGLNKFQIYLQGGGWCGNPGSCYARGQPGYYLGSSLNYTEYAWYSADYLDDNETSNPLLYNWNTIWMIYCDGSSFTGNNLTVYDYKVNDTYSYPLYFRGHINLNEGLKVLWNEYGLDTATDVVLSGCSAGGLAVFLNSNFVYDNYVTNEAKPKFMSLPQSGFFPYDNPFASSPWHDNLEWIYNTQNVTDVIDQYCVAYYQQTNESLSKCMFAQYVSQFLNRYKVFPLQSIYDAAGLSEQRIDTNNNTEVNLYGQWFAELFLNNYVYTNISLHSGYIYSCYSHCGEWNQINTNNIIDGNAIQMFYYNNLNKQYNDTYLLFQNNTYPCNECCFYNGIIPNNITICKYSNEECDPTCQ